LTLKNLRNFNTALSQLEAITELGRETASTTQKLVMNFIQQVGQLESKGYFEHGRKAAQAMDTFIQNLPRDTFQKMEAAAPELAKLAEELSNPEEISKVRRLLQKRKMLASALMAAWIIPVALLVANLFV
jgi:histidyl-tRNA synthetase